MEITSKRIDAKPRSKYKRYNGYNISSSIDNNGGGSSGGMNLSNVVLLSGRTSQIVQGELGASGDVIAYATKEHDITLPIASTDALGAIKVGSGLTINDGVLSVTGGSGGGTGTVSEWGDIKGTLSNQTDLWNELGKKANSSSLNISNWDSAYNLSHSHSNKSTLDTITSSDISHWDIAYSRSHTHSNKSYLDNINQYLSTTSNVKHSSLTCTGDVIAYSTGTASAPFKYWRPSVSSSGVLSWTNSTSETTPTSVNIKGAKGDKGDPGQDGKDGVDGATFNGGTITEGITITNSSSRGLYLNCSSPFVNGKNGLYLQASGTNRLFLGTYQAQFTNLSGGVAIIYSSPSLVLDGDTNGEWKIGFSSSNNKALTFTRESTQLMRMGTDGVLWVYKSVSEGSDERLKTRKDDVTDVLDNIDNIEIFRYTLNDDETQTTQIGVSAQNLIDIYPELVNQSDEYYSVAYNRLGCIAIEGLKELKQIVNTQQSEIELLKTQINELKQLINEKNNTVISEDI